MCSDRESGMFSFFSPIDCRSSVNTTAISLKKIFRMPELEKVCVLKICHSTRYMILPESPASYHIRALDITLVWFQVLHIQ